MNDEEYEFWRHDLPPGTKVRVDWDDINWDDSDYSAWEIDEIYDTHRDRVFTIDFRFTEDGIQYYVFKENDAFDWLGSELVKVENGEG